MAWREAASLIVASAAPSGFKLLLLQRVASSSFMPNLFVFPGGHLDAADANPAWLLQFPSLADFAADAAASRPAQLMPLLAEHASRAVVGELSFRLCALRETFEESGLLLAARGPHRPVVMTDLADMDAQQWRLWQQRVKNDAQQFLALHEQLSLVPDVWSLREWSNWLTPVRMKKRFDTAFFLYTAPEERQLEAVEKERDEAEVAKVEWIGPEESLRRHLEGSLQLAPPQIYEMARFCEFADLQELERFAIERERFGNARYCPYIVQAKDGRFSFLPGDFRYPGDEVACHKPDEVMFEEALGEDTGDLNRLCITAANVHCNVRTSGHVMPTIFARRSRL